MCGNTILSGLLQLCSTIWSLILPAFLYFQLPARSCWSLSSFLFSFFLSFVLPGFDGIFLVFIDVLSFLLIFSMCSARTVPCADVFLMQLWGQKCSTSSYSAILTPLCPHFCFVDQGNLDFSTLLDILLYVFVDRQACVLSHTKYQIELQSYIIKKHNLVYRDSNCLGEGGNWLVFVCFLFIHFIQLLVFYVFLSNPSIFSRIVESIAMHHFKKHRIINFIWRH